MNNKYFITLIILGIFSARGFAQESIIGNVDYVMLDKYIQIAKDYYPRKKLTDAQQEISKAGVTVANLSYLDIFSASYIYRPNEQTAIVTPGQNVNPYVVNGIQYAISINLGGFLQKPFLVKRAKAEYKVAKLQSLDYEITLVSEVKKRYYTYIQMLTELKIRTQKAQDNVNVADNARRRFEKGEIMIDVYNNSRVQLADSNSEKIQTEVDYLNAKDALEEMLGQKLTEIK